MYICMCLGFHRVGQLQTIRVTIQRCVYLLWLQLRVMSEAQHLGCVSMQHPAQYAASSSTDVYRDFSHKRTAKGVKELRRGLGTSRFEHYSLNGFFAKGNVISKGDGSESASIEQCAILQWRSTHKNCTKNTQARSNIPLQERGLEQSPLRNCEPNESSNTGSRE